MSCATCQATFSALKGMPLAERALSLDEREPECRCQVVTVSEHSPGLVSDTEILIRILVAPQHVTKQGRPRSAALTDAERSGLSVFREELASDEEILSVAKQVVEKARASQGGKAGVTGVLRIECGTIRAFRVLGEDPPACYCVYDTALEQIPSHAEAFQRVAGVTDERRDERRRCLFDQLKATFVPVDEFRDGLLKDLAPEGR